MSKLKKGDIVGRISYGKDILFIVERIVKCKNKESFAILKGLTVRIMADSPLEDLEMIEKERVENHIRSFDARLEDRAKTKERTALEMNDRIHHKKLQQKVITGKILHLDGDPKYTDKSLRYYKNLGLTAIVKNIPENRQPMVIRSLLERYKPDVLVITRT